AFIGVVSFSLSDSRFGRAGPHYSWGSSRNRIEVRPEACSTGREGNHSLWSPLAPCLSLEHWARSVHESCDLGAVVRVYQCQIVKKPVNAPVRSLTRLRHRSGGILSSKEHGMGSQHTEFHRSACPIDARGTLTAM